MRKVMFHSENLVSVDVFKKSWTILFYRFDLWLDSNKLVNQDLLYFSNTNLFQII